MARRAVLVISSRNALERGAGNGLPAPDPEIAFEVPK